MRWNLDNLYTSFDSKEYNEDFSKLENLINEFENKYNDEYFNSTSEKDALEEIIKDSSQLNTLVRKIAAFSSLTSATDATNEDALRSMDKISQMMSLMAKPDTRIQTYIKNIKDLNKVIDSSDLLQEHRFYLNEIYTQSKYLLSEEEEVLISKLKNSGSTAWSNLQNKLTSTLMVDVEIDGKIESLPLPVVRNMAYSPDKETRIKGYEAELKAYKKIEESSAAALNGIKGEVLTTSEARGYKSPLEETLINSRMEKETLDAMLSAMEEYLPVFHKYFRKKAELLGYDGGLPFYEMFAPIGELETEFTYEEAIDYIVKNFGTFSPELANFVQNAYDNDWLDVEPREGKRGGAFCSNLHPIGESRILSNFTGSFSDMITLAHELGHGYHGHTLMKESVLNTSYPMPIAETASIFCETIVTSAALKTASEKEELTILESSISDSAQVIVDIYSRFLFESELFERRKDYSLSVQELNEIMLDAQKKSYGNGLDQDILHPYMWLNKTHYYSAGRNFYNFPYAFGLLFSKGLYAEYLVEGDSFVDKYNELLEATGKNQIEDITKIVGIDIQNPEFFKNSLKLIEKDIERFIELADK